jgi:peptide/nickel transport system permease protein
MSSIDPPLSPHSPRAPYAVLRRLLREPAAVIGGAILLFFVALALLAPYVAPYDPLASDWGSVRLAPDLAHPFGTDDLGRDILSRVVFGARASLAASLVSVAIAMLAGIPLGLCAGYFGGVADMLVSRAADAVLSCPFLVLAIALATFLGPSLENAMIAIGISSIPIFVRLARGQTLAVREEDYISAALLLGLPHRKIILGHVLPNVLPPLLVQATLTAAIAVLAEASLAFLGLGQAPPAPSWGGMLDQARQFLTDAPWMAVSPGLAIVALVIAFNMLGDALNDVLNPRG